MLISSEQNIKFVCSNLNNYSVRSKGFYLHKTLQILIHTCHFRGSVVFPYDIWSEIPRNSESQCVWAGRIWVKFKFSFLVSRCVNRKPLKWNTLHHWGHDSRVLWQNIIQKMLLLYPGVTWWAIIKISCITCMCYLAVRFQLWPSVP